jgi:acetoin utilization protein AcuB
MAGNSSGILNKISEARVADRMTREVITINPSDSCERALSIMRKSLIKHLPVLEGKRLVGILTERDIQRRLPRIRVFGSTNEGKLLTLVKVGGVMTYGPVTVTPVVPLREAAAIMLKYGIGSLPVVQQGDLVGILTSKDAVG